MLTWQKNSIFLFNLALHTITWNMFLCSSPICNSHRISTSSTNLKIISIWKRIEITRLPLRRQSKPSSALTHSYPFVASKSSIYNEFLIEKIQAWVLLICASSGKLILLVVFLPIVILLSTEISITNNYYIPSVTSRTRFMSSIFLTKNV